MYRILPVLCALPLLLAYGVAAGLWTDRWQVSPELEQAPQRLAALPLTVGDWQSADVELDARQVVAAELHGHLQRNYLRRSTGDALQVLVVCGRPGPIAVHSPEVCFGGAGFTPAAARTRFALEGQDSSAPAEFWEERYQKAGAAVPEQLQIYYGWNAGDGWVAVDNPRLYSPWARAMYKVYVVRSLPRIDEPAEKDPIPGFLRLFVPQLNHSLELMR
jgi:hypothetical protein